MMSDVNITGQLGGLRDFQHPAAIVDATILSRGGYDYGIVLMCPEANQDDGIH